MSEENQINNCPFCQSGTCHTFGVHNVYNKIFTDAENDLTLRILDAKVTSYVYEDARAKFDGIIPPIRKSNLRLETATEILEKRRQVMKLRGLKANSHAILRLENRINAKKGIFRFSPKADKDDQE